MMDAGNVENNFREVLLRRKQADARSILLTKDEYYVLIEDVKEAAKTKKKTNRQYYLIGRYAVLQCGDVEKLIRKQNCADDDPVFFTHIDDMFDIIKRAHISVGHGGRDKMSQALHKYANITRDSIELYKSMCIECQKKKESVSPAKVWL